MTGYPPVYPGESGQLVLVARHGWADDEVTPTTCGECEQPGAGPWRKGHRAAQEGYVIRIELPWVLVQWQATGRWEMVDHSRVLAGWGS